MLVFLTMRSGLKSRLIRSPHSLFTCGLYHESPRLLDYFRDCLYAAQLECTEVRGDGLVVSTHTVVAGSIPAFSTCLFHVVPRVLGGAADEKACTDE